VRNAAPSVQNARLRQAPALRFEARAAARRWSLSMRSRGASMHRAAIVRNAAPSVQNARLHCHRCGQPRPSRSPPESRACRTALTMPTPSAGAPGFGFFLVWERKIARMRGRTDRAHGSSRRGAPRDRPLRAHVRSEIPTTKIIKRSARAWRTALSACGQARCATNERDARGCPHGDSAATRSARTEPSIPIRKTRDDVAGSGNS
jgi:hypothetical protein